MSKTWKLRKTRQTEMKRALAASPLALNRRFRTMPNP